MGWCSRIVFALGLGACINANLTPCDDVTCPVDKICNAVAGCIYPQQLIVCAGLPDASSCSYAPAAAGTCELEICQPLGCGNGVKTANEACDDGNNINGDGCAADCTSNEQCGNGFTDLGANEQCDDGNADDFDDCRNNCSLPRCNDGTLDPLEECDPKAPDQPTTTCGELGYHGGTIGCSSTCRLDPVATCEGKCGDGVVQATYEQCDGSPPAFSCIDNGFDFGAIACASTCTADPHSCERFGWLYTRDVPSTPWAVASDGGTIAIANSDGSLAVSDAGVWTTTPGSYKGADVRGSQLLVATSSTVQLRDHGAWTAVPDPPLGGETIVQVVLAGDGTPMVRSANGPTCHVHELVQGAWTTAAQPCGTLEAAAADDFTITVNVSTTGTVYWPAAGRTDAMPGPANVIGVDRIGDQLLVYSYKFSVFDDQTGTTYYTLFRHVVPRSGPIVTTTLASMFDGSPQRAAIWGGELFVPRGKNIVRMSADHFEEIDGAPRNGSTSFTMWIGHDGDVYSSGDPATPSALGIYALQPFAQSHRGPPSASAVVGLSETSNFLACDSIKLYRSFWWAWQTDNLPPSSDGANCTAPPWGPDWNTVYVARTLGGNGLWKWNGSWSQQLFMGTPISAIQVTGEGSTTLAVQPASADLLSNASGTWQAITPSAPCEVTATAITGGTIYAAGHCSGAPTLRLWQLGVAWTELYTTDSTDTIESLVVAPDGTIVAGTSGQDVITRIAGVWEWQPQLGNLVGATRQDNIYALATAPNSHAALHHWDGSQWVVVRVERDAVYSSFVVGPRDVAATGNTIWGPTWTGLLYDR